MRLAFDEYNAGVGSLTGQGVWLAIDVLFDLLFLVDIAINFRTAFMVAGELETRSKAICKQYLSTWFFLDAIASVPTTIITAAVNSGVQEGGDTDSTSGLKANQILRGFKWFKLIKLMRVIRLSRITDRLEHITMFWNAGTLRLIRSIMLLCVLWHLVACAYWGVASSQGFCEWSLTMGLNATYSEYFKWDSMSGAEPNGFQDCYDDWVPWVQITDEPFSTQYTQAFFWAVMVTTGVGKDINPQSEAETTFTIIVIAVGVFMYAIM